ncbi:MAG: hypothetical protein H6746_11290 [Deltaproteobacteria bacterium]|nr:hypothetical protein [Deltaproteobacteria bacterium]
MRRRLSLPLAACLALALGASLALPWSACLSDKGERCAIDSDCSSGYACSPEGLCVTFEQLLESFSLKHGKPKDVITTKDTVVADSPEVGPDGDGGATCKEPRGIFEPGAGPCLEPDQKIKVVGLCIAPSGHGTEGLAAVGNPILADQFSNDTFKLEAWIDGELGPGCHPTIRWLRDPSERKADCSVVHGDNVPIEVIGIIELFVESPVYDPVTHILTGIIDEDALLEAIDPAIKQIADNFIEKDVDTDGDSVPDKASVIVTVQLAPEQPTECPTE